MTVDVQNAHARRRAQLMTRHDDGLILVRGVGADRTNMNFRYLTGLDEPRGALLLAPGGLRVGTGRANPGADYVRGRIVHQVLFLPARDELAARWGEDSVATLEGVDRERVGVDVVLADGQLDAVLTAALSTADVLYYVRGMPASLAGDDDADTLFLDRVKRRFFGLSYRDATPAVHEQRRIKDDDEVRAIERSASVVGEAFDHLFKTVRSGTSEYELEAEISRIYRLHAGTHAFDPIVATGLNATLLHYGKNASPVTHGQLLLVDTGVSIDGYKADVTRCLPVDGSFSGRQRLIYETVLAAQEAAIERCRAGALLADIHARAFEVIDQAGFGEQFVHGTSHHIGLETHDVGDVHAPLAAGCVITVEPGIYIPDEEIGVRIEDDVLVTDGNPRVLTAAIPKNVAEVERRMGG